MEQRTFSESWHRVANLRVTLRHAVAIRRQCFAGAVWHVLHDPFSNQFFRLSAAAYAFVARLRPDRTVEQVWEECLSRDPDGTPGQDEVIQLLAQLYHAGLISCDLPPDSGRLFERLRERRQREARSRLLNLMFFRLPLFDPEPLLRRGEPLVRLLTGRLALAVWLAVIVLAVKSVVEQYELIGSEARNLLAFDNLALLYAGLILVKTLHEFGHTLVCRRLGGEVRTIGIMLVVFTPLPYMDATSSWAFRSRWQRILVAASGVIFEFFAAACAALVWAHTGPGALHSLAFNMMVVASVSTFVFNLNPLLRFDGYFILSDLIDVPNLQTRALAQLRHLVSICLFGEHHEESPAGSRAEAFWLSTYGIASGSYRMAVCVGIILFVADRYLVAGLLIALTCLVTWGIVPAVRFFAALATSPALTRNRRRAVLVALLAGGLLVLALGVVPLPDRILAPGVLEANNFLKVSSKAAGRLTDVYARNGSPVEPGTPLLRLASPELDLEIAVVEAQRAEVLSLVQQNIALQGGSGLDVLERRMKALDERRRQLADQQESLLVNAAMAGTWIAPDLYMSLGVWLPRGTELGTIVDTDAFRFSAVVSQEEAARLFARDSPPRAEIRLVGQGSTTLTASNYLVIPYEQQLLPSAALGWHSGGEVPVSAKDERGLQTVEPYFRIYADIDPEPEAVLTHGHSGRIRIALPPKPLLVQLARSAWQFFQKRYQL